MAEITLQGNPVHTSGELPTVGSPAPDFELTGSDLDEVSLSAFVGDRIVLNIFPSIDTPVCADSVRAFNAEAAARDDAVVLCVSNDLPFAQGRFCSGEGLEEVVTLSGFRSPGFGDDYGVRMIDGPMAELLARAVVVVDASGDVVHTQLVPEIAEEPDYEAAMAALDQLDGPSR